VPAPSDKVRAILGKLADLPAEAEAREKTVADLKTENANLKREVTLAKKAQPETKVERVEVPVLQAEHIALVQALQSQLHEVQTALIVALGQAKNPRIDPKPIRSASEFRVTPKPVKRQSTGEADATLGKCERSILRVLACFEDGCTSGKLTLLSGYRYSGGFKNSLATLRVNGYMDGANTGVMTITDAGFSALGDFEPLPQGADLAAYWLNHSSFGKCERAILQALLDHPRGLNKDQLCEITDYEFSGGFKNSLSNLRTAGVIVGKNMETMRAHEDLF
jgi:hypothetical protein